MQPKCGFAHPPDWPLLSSPSGMQVVEGYSVGPPHHGYVAPAQGHQPSYEELAWLEQQMHTAQQHMGMMQVSQMGGQPMGAPPNNSSHYAKGRNSRRWQEAPTDAVAKPTGDEVDMKDRTHPNEADEHSVMRTEFIAALQSARTTLLQAQQQMMMMQQAAHAAQVRAHAYHGHGAPAERMHHNGYHHNGHHPNGYHPNGSEPRSRSPKSHKSSSGAKQNHRAAGTGGTGASAAAGASTSAASATTRGVATVVKLTVRALSSTSVSLRLRC